MGAIYSILNNVNGKIYVGQTIRPMIREKEHFNKLNNNSHPNGHLQSAFNKYGGSAFEFNILESCSDEMLDENEIWWISYFDATNREKGYNIGAGGYINVMKNPDVVKKFSESRSGKNHHFYGKHLSEEHRKKISDSNKGRKHSEESKRKISESRKGMVFTEEHKRNISLNHADQSGENNGCWGTSVIEDFGGLDYLLDCINQGKTQTAVAAEIGINRSTIYDYLKARGYKWAELAKGGDT